MERCIFVDRDGTLIEDRGYVHRIEDYAPLPGVFEGLRLLRDAGFGIVIVTNQSGIGRGYFDAAQFERFQAHLLADFAREGAPIDATYHCPHRPDEGCACRKPATGMLERAARELGVDLSESWMIGDKWSDVQLAKNAGCHGLRLWTAPNVDFVSPLASRFAKARDWDDAAQLICLVTPQEQ